MLVFSVYNIAVRCGAPRRSDAAVVVERRPRSTKRRFVRVSCSIVRTMSSVAAPFWPRNAATATSLAAVHRARLRRCRRAAGSRSASVEIRKRMAVGFREGRGVPGCTAKSTARAASQRQPLREESARSRIGQVHVGRAELRLDRAVFELVPSSVPPSCGWISTDDSFGPAVPKSQRASITSNPLLIERRRIDRDLGSHAPAAGGRRACSTAHFVRAARAVRRAVHRPNR